jgi:hypothetical protein
LGARDGELSELRLPVEAIVLSDWRSRYRCRPTLACIAWFLYIAKSYESNRPVTLALNQIPLGDY